MFQPVPLVIAFVRLAEQKKKIIIIPVNAFEEKGHWTREKLELTTKCMLTSQALILYVPVLISFLPEEVVLCYRDAEAWGLKHLVVLLEGILYLGKVGQEGNYLDWGTTDEPLSEGCPGELGRSYCHWTLQEVLVANPGGTCAALKLLYSLYSMECQSGLKVFFLY